MPTIVDVSRGPERLRRNLIDSVYSRLKEDVFEFRLAPGTRLSESELAARLGVSRSPLRVALYMLAREGYMQRVDTHAGWQVRPLDFHYFEELYEVRVQLELMAIKGLCEADPFPDLGALRDSWLVPAGERVAEPTVVAALDETFHSTLMQAAGNAEAARMHAEIGERIRIIRRLDFTAPARVDATYVEHGKLLRAVLARRRGDAELLLRSHIDGSRAEIRHITLARLAQAREQGERTPMRSRA